MDKIDELIASLEHLLKDGGINDVFYIDPDSEQAVPQGGNLSRFDRLAVPFSGCHRMHIPTEDGIKQLFPQRHNATFMPIGSWNKPDWGLPVNVVTFGFTSEYINYSFVDCPGEELSKRTGDRGQVGWCSSDAKFILRLMNKIFSISPDEPRARPLTETMIAYCLESLKKRLVPQAGKAHSTYMNICSYLEECYTSDLSRDEVAGLFQISANYLSNLFKAQSGISFNTHINQLRIKRACHLLRNFNQTLDEVALSCGYHETGYFCRVFKKYTGQTPGEFRNASVAI
jgi:AraC-like DNA-binding protein